MTIFIVGCFSVFFLLFIVILSFANVLVDKEIASNNAEQASIVASGIMLDHLEEAIEDYDDWLRPLLLLDPIPEYVLGLHPLEDDVEMAMNALPSTLSEPEKRHKAINQVLKNEIPGNYFLKNFVQNQLNLAKSKIRIQVKENIENNNSEISKTKIIFNEKHRIEVETATRYETIKFDEYLDENHRYIKQKGYGPTFEFAESFNWNFSHNYE